MGSLHQRSGSSRRRHEDTFTSKIVERDHRPHHRTDDPPAGRCRAHLRHKTTMVLFYWHANRSLSDSTTTLRSFRTGMFPSLFLHLSEVSVMSISNNLISSPHQTFQRGCYYMLQQPSESPLMLLHFRRLLMFEQHRLLAHNSSSSRLVDFHSNSHVLLRDDNSNFIKAGFSAQISHSISSRRASTKSSSGPLQLVRHLSGRLSQTARRPGTRNVRRCCGLTHPNLRIRKTHVSVSACFGGRMAPGAGALEDSVLPMYSAVPFGTSTFWQGLPFSELRKIFPRVLLSCRAFLSDQNDVETVCLSARRAES